MAKKSETGFRKISDFADCQAALENWQKLKSQQKGLTAEVTALEQECGADPGGTRAAASTLVKGSTAVLTDHRQQLVEARQQLAVVTEASQQQQTIWSAMQCDVRAEMCAERLARHQQLIASIGSALANLELAIAAERDFIAQLKSDGGKLQPPMVGFIAPRDLGVLPQRSEMWRTHMRKLGYLAGAHK